MQRAVVLRWIACLAVAAVLLQQAAGQGLAPSGSLAANNAAAASLAQKYASEVGNAQTLASSYRALSPSQRQRCAGGKQKAALCASQGGSSDEAVSLALSPQVFSWTNPPGAGGGGIGSLVNPFGPVGDQGECWTCVSFAVAAAAEAAVARALGLSGGTVKFSVQDLGFCPEKDDDLRFCQTAWSLNSALAKLQKQQPVVEGCLRYQTGLLDEIGTKCNYACKTQDQYASKGKFIVRQIRTLVAAQRQIRRFGGVITRINLYKDFKPFFRASPTGVYEGKGCQGGDFEEGHAAVIVGYNNKDQYWVVRNSWGPGFADQGYFKIKYGVCGIGQGDMYGIAWVPDSPQKIPYAVSPDSEKPGCFIYRARSGDSLGILADTWGVDGLELLYNNSAAIDDLNGPIDGKLLTVCGISTNNVDLKTPSWVLEDTVTPTYTPTRTERPTSRRSRSSSTVTETGSTPSSSTTTTPSSSRSTTPSSSTTTTPSSSSTTPSTSSSSEGTMPSGNGASTASTAAPAPAPARAPVSSGGVFPFGGFLGRRHM